MSDLVGTQTVGFLTHRLIANHQLEFVFYVKTDVSPLSMCMSKIGKQDL